MQISNRLEGRYIKLLDSYVDTDTKVRFKCLKENCGHIWITVPSSILSKHKSGCPLCANNIKLSNVSFDNKLIGRNIRRLDTYRGARVSIRFKCLCKDCNYIWKTTPTHIISKRKQGCPKCYGNVKLNNTIVDNKLIGKSIKRIGKYINVMSKIKFKCLNCKNTWKAMPDKIINGNRGCPNCKIGRSEKNVKRLIKAHIKCKNFKQHKLIKFKNKIYYPDFYFEKDEKLFIVEYNGEQHYKPVCFGGMSKLKARQKFKRQIIRDKQVKNYCLLNNINFIEIPYYYTEKEIVSLLGTI